VYLDWNAINIMRTMLFLPFQDLEFESPLSSVEIYDVINSHVARSKTFFGNSFSKNTYKEYEGYMEGNTFKIRRILKWGRNSFIPITTGVVSNNKSGNTTIKLKIRLHYLVTIFLLIFTLFAFILFLTEAFRQPYENQTLIQLVEQYNLDSIDISNEPKVFNWTSVFFMFIPYLISTIAFNYESKKVKDELKMLLKVK